MAPLNDTLYRYVMNAHLGTTHDTSVGELLVWIEENKNPSKGEMVLTTEGHKAQNDKLPIDALCMLTLLQAEVPLKQTAALAAETHGVERNVLYKYAQEQQGD